MKISGAAIVRNGVKFGYPFIESIKSILPICGEFIVAVGDSDDDTRQRIEDINDPKIRIIDTVWDPESRKHGEILSQQTNVVLPQCKGEWIFYLQADEAVCEKDFEKIMGAISIADKNPEIEALVFNYLHFYGSYYTVQSGRNWYKQEVRVIRNNRGIESFGDAQGFRKIGKKVKAMLTDARIFHYGWVKPPDVMLDKVKSFQRFWHDDVWIEKNFENKHVKEFFSDLGNLVEYAGEHPSVMSGLVNRNDEVFIKSCCAEYLKARRFSDVIRDFSRSLPLGRNKNYKL